ncbi:MAG: phosphopyruvate hydratase [Candidatus Levybacteria bacterium RIFOXYA1_FULL_41_10]|nr:MAG: Enolase [Candidatus Levybacteria bacterium GW2011_GWA1_39_34]KKR50839.1 MAG: Enolase [Candidatus Levybacteria bacterium GW2011_GWC1_40_19]KKR95258.1 MAG: Enolase [Candidatus Levybacteria bacterium GW2011_GWA2_41_15]KKS01786.1 MAG: Enolase [Candidatus Levybacteria bacterium GW2011_GWB1_41_21]OGH20369.1 MAG: phosphopyruvate hydratase [Candidatus Levybacteria bacterium RIFCSPHIGHO2_01_FULL_40_83]OGH25159.1 MAG: phosphopyruvate hydratase [Candidatus Levybacteria bacterium RIFCSPHIGHO2_02_F
MSKIKQIFSREILNSKATPTLETTVVLSDGTVASASCPSGTSVGSYEAAELRDNDPEKFQGKGVLKAVENVEKIIAPILLDKDATKQQEIDNLMMHADGTLNKGKLGANAILSVSMAVAKAASISLHLPLFMYLREYIKNENIPLKIPTPAFNLINGGKHANNNMDFQEFLVIPATSISYPESLNLATSVYQSIRKNLEERNAISLTGDEGGYAPTFPTNKEGLTFLQEAIMETKYRPNYDVFLGLDCSADNFYSSKEYKLKDSASAMSSEALVSFYNELTKEFHFIYLEDPMSEDDWEGWANLNQKISHQTIIVGDDLVATNPYRLQIALDRKAITGIIIKPNQIGTVIEALAMVEAARLANLKIVVSHRSAETNDDFIADFSVAVSADYVKFGAPSRGERVAKYNRLLLIDRQLRGI